MSGQIDRPSEDGVPEDNFRNVLDTIKFVDVFPRTCAEIRTEYSRSYEMRKKTTGLLKKALLKRVPECGDLKKLANKVQRRDLNEYLLEKLRVLQKSENSGER